MLHSNPTSGFTHSVRFNVEEHELYQNHLAFVVRYGYELMVFTWPHLSFGLIVKAAIVGDAKQRLMRNDF